jgi:hypothetical protein
MSPESLTTIEHVALIVRRSLEAGAAVEIDGLGCFRARRDGSFDFRPQTRPQVFIAYVEEDLPTALRLYHDLRSRGYNPWIDKKRLLPGQNWPRAIEQAIDVSDFFIPCFSPRSVRKKGQFQAELRYALDCAARLPLDEVYFIPVRIADCLVPPRICREIQYVDLFPDWDQGLERVVATMDAQRLRQAVRLK